MSDTCCDCGALIFVREVHHCSGKGGFAPPPFARMAPGPQLPPAHELVRSLSDHDLTALVDAVDKELERRGYRRATP